jgi:hypothetical protein
VADAIRRCNPDMAHEMHRLHWLRATRAMLDVLETYRLQRL